MSSPVLRFPLKLDGVLVVPRPDGKAERSEMIGALTGALALLAESRDPAGKAYRRGLVGRIRSILERERGR